MPALGSRLGCAGPDAIQPPPSTVAMPGAGRRTTDSAKYAAGVGCQRAVGVEQRRPVQPGAGRDLGDRRIGRGRDDASGPAAVDELQVGMLPYGVDDGTATGHQFGHRPLLHGADRAAAYALTGRRVAEPGDLRLVRHDRDQPYARAGGDRGRESAGLFRAVYRRPPYADVHPAAGQPPRRVEIETDADGLAVAGGAAHCPRSRSGRLSRSSP